MAWFCSRSPSITIDARQSIFTGRLILEAHLLALLKSGVSCDWLSQWNLRHGMHHFPIEAFISRVSNSFALVIMSNDYDSENACQQEMCIHLDPWVNTISWTLMSTRTEQIVSLELTIEIQKCLFFFTSKFFLFYVYECFACMCVCAPCSTCGGHKGALEPLEPELQMVVSIHMRA